VKIHEYQAKAILARHGVPVPPGEVAHTPREAREIAERLGLSVKTVSTYRTRILEKMSLGSNAEIIQYAVRNGLVS